MPLADGANCQRYAHAVLDLFGLYVPALRSSELADDPRLIRIEEQRSIRPLDLLLLNESTSTYGAHVGVHLADDHVLHLCAELGRPTVWRSPSSPTGPATTIRSQAYEHGAHNSTTGENAQAGLAAVSYG